MANPKQTTRIVFEEGVEAVEFPAGLQLPAEFALEIDRAGYRLELVIAYRDGRYGIRGLAVQRSADAPEEITGELLRSLTPKDDLRRGLAMLLDEHAGLSGWTGVASPPDGIADQGPTDEVLSWVAQTYALARAFNAPPTKAVQDELGVSRATAGRWVAEARRHGLINADTEED